MEQNKKETMTEQNISENEPKSNNELVQKAFDCVENAYLHLSRVNDFGKSTVYDDRYEKSNALSQLSEVSNVCYKILNGTNQ